MLVPVLSDLRKQFKWEIAAISLAVILFWLTGDEFAAAIPSAAGASQWAFKAGRAVCYAASAGFGAGGSVTLGNDSRAPLLQNVIYCQMSTMYYS